MIQITNLSKKFNSFTAVDNISFEVRPGEVLGFLGPNGAGKSTTMKMLTGFLEPTDGSISVLNHDVINNPLKAQEVIGYLPEGAPAYGDMTVQKFLEFIAEVRGFKGSESQSRVKAVVEKVNLHSVVSQTIETLSKGYKRRVGLAQAIIHDPKVLILDEPTDGLDPNQKYQVRELIRNLSEDKIVIVSTHILEEVSAVCTRAMILASGKILFDGTPDELAAKSEFHNAISLRIEGESASIVDELSSLECVKEVLPEDGTGGFTVLPASQENILGEVNSVLHRNNAVVLELHVEKGKLDDVFRSVTAQAV